MIIIAGHVSRILIPSKLYFLIGYTEEMLSLILKRPVRLEVQTVAFKKDMVFKHV